MVKARVGELRAELRAESCAPGWRGGGGGVYHEAEDALDGVVDVAEGARLLAVAPHLERLRRRDRFAAEGGGRLLAPALPRAARPVDVMEAADPAHHPEVLLVVHQELLGHQLLEAVRVLRLRRPRVVLLQPRRALEVLLQLLELRVDARRRRVPATGEGVRRVGEVRRSAPNCAQTCARRVARRVARQGRAARTKTA